MTNCSLLKHMGRPSLTFFNGSRVKGILLVILLLALSLILILPRQTQSLLEHLGSPLAQLIAVPIQALATLDYEARESWNRYIALQGVHEKNLTLQHTVDQLKGQVNLLREQVIISEQLAQLLDYQKLASIETVAARVIGRNATNWYRALIIDKGEQQGILEEMGVISPAGVVGQVIKTTSSTAMVLLLSDPNVAVTAMIQRTRDEGIVQGTAQGLVRMKYIPPLSPVEINDIVVTSGLTENFPRGLQIGSIRRLEKADADLFQSAEIQPIVDFSRLEGVLVITSLGLASESRSLSLSPPTQPDLVQ